MLKRRVTFRPNSCKEYNTISLLPDLNAGETFGKWVPLKRRVALEIPPTSSRVVVQFQPKKRRLGKEEVEGQSFPL